MQYFIVSLLKVMLQNLWFLIAVFEHLCFNLTYSCVPYFEKIDLNDILQISEKKTFFRLKLVA